MSTEKDTGKDTESTELEYSDRRDLPVLYKTDARGKERMWRVWCEKDTVKGIYGLVDGAKIPTERSFKSNRNLTAEEKTWAEANKRWIKQTEKGYAPKSEEGLSMMLKLQEDKKNSGGHNMNAVSAISGAQKKKNVKRKVSDTEMVAVVQNGMINPMKASEWELNDPKDPYSVKHSNAKYFTLLGEKKKGVKQELLDTPFYGQPKLDGWRANVIYQFSDSGEPEIAITSNNKKQYPWFKSLREVILTWLGRVREAVGDEFDQLILDGLDGEVYAQSFVDENGTPIPQDMHFRTIQQMSGLARTKPHELEDQIQYHVFDLVDRSSTFKQHERFAKLDELFKHITTVEQERIVRVDTEILQSVREVPDFHDRCVKLGYEGVILRAHEMLYLNKRALNMRKFKHFFDAEYEVTDCKLDEGVATEHFVWVCKVSIEKNGQIVEKLFKAKPSGSKAVKLAMYADRGEYIGRILTVKFQELTKDGVPRFPIGKAFRDIGDI